jgi:hypothetical protein
MRINSRIEQNIDFIVKSMEESKPIDWICRHIKVSRDTLRKRFPMYKGSQGLNVEKVKRLGVIETLIKHCKRCNKEFSITGRTKTKSFYRRDYCSISCSKARDAYWAKNISYYTTICWKYHKKECIICGEDKIVAVHHYDSNHNNNKPSNLIPLCPTHHQYIHSKYKSEILNRVEVYVNNFSGELV